jgi:hypothetical protein
MAPAWAASKVTIPGYQGVMVNTPATGPVMVTSPVVPVTLTTTSVTGSPELTLGCTVKAPVGPMTCVPIGAKLSECHVAPNMPVM